MRRIEAITGEEALRARDGIQLGEVRREQRNLDRTLRYTIHQSRVRLELENTTGNRCSTTNKLKLNTSRTRRPRTLMSAPLTF